MESQPFSKFCRASLLVGAALSGMLGVAVSVRAQALKDVQTPDTPLVLKAQGSFFVGGEKVEQTAGELGDLGPGGHITVNQMYVRYMVPQGGEGNVPVVMMHGGEISIIMSTRPLSATADLRPCSTVPPECGAG